MSRATSGRSQRRISSDQNRAAHFPAGLCPDRYCVSSDPQRSTSYDAGHSHRTRRPRECRCAGAVAFHSKCNRARRGCRYAAAFSGGAFLYELPLRTRVSRGWSPGAAGIGETPGMACRGAVGSASHGFGGKYIHFPATPQTGIRRVVRRLVGGASRGSHRTAKSRHARCRGERRIPAEMCGTRRVFRILGHALLAGIRATGLDVRQRPRDLRAVCMRSDVSAGARYGDCTMDGKSARTPRSENWLAWASGVGGFRRTSRWSEGDIHVHHPAVSRGGDTGTRRGTLRCFSEKHDDDPARAALRSRVSARGERLR